VKGNFSESGLQGLAYPWVAFPPDDHCWSWHKGSSRWLEI